MTRFLILLGCFFSFFAHATQSTVMYIAWNGAAPQSTLDSACEIAAGLRTAQTGSSTVFTYSQSMGCYGHLGGGQASDLYANAVRVGWCPSGQVAEGAECPADCPFGQFRDASGQCKKDCTGKMGQSTPSPSNEFANDGGSPMISGCEVNCDTWAAPKGSTALLPLYQVGSNCRFTGKPPAGDGTEGTGFKPAPDAPKKPSDCTGSGMGYVQTSSGTTCVPASDSPDTAPKVTDKKQTVEGPAGADGQPDPNSPDTKKKDTETTTDPGTGKTTVKETVTSPPSVDSGGNKSCPSGMTLIGEVCQGVKSTTTNTSDYCAQNPTAAACGGSQNSDSCSEHPDRASCANFGDPAQSDSSALPVRDVGVSSITEVTLNSDATCPVGAPMPFGIGTFPMDGICMFASGMKPIIIVMAWVAAALIVIGAFRGDS